MDDESIGEEKGVLNIESLGRRGGDGEICSFVN